MQNYKGLKVWEKAHEFTLKIYQATNAFPKEERYGLTSQLRRSSASIAANIAEGSGKNSPKDFANFLNVALGSANESEYYLILSRDLKYMDEEIFKILEKAINEVKAMLISLVIKVKT